MIWEDPIVKETRVRREAYAEKFGHDLDAIFEDIRQCQGKAGRKVVVREPRRPKAVRNVA
jgi:hypothetical protein